MIPNENIPVMRTIIIGIVSVTLMGAAIDGLNRSFHESISVMGADVLFADRMSWFINTQEEWLKQYKRRVVTLDQVKLVEKQMTLASAVAPVVQTSRSVRYNNHSTGSVTIIGTTDQFLLTGGLGVDQGRFLTDSDAAGGRPVCVIGYDVATNLFVRESPLGKRIRIGPRLLEVVGVLEKQGGLDDSGGADNSPAYSPDGKYLLVTNVSDLDGESFILQIDLQTGAVRFEWHTITDIAIDESYVDPPADPTASIYDYVHANSIEVDHDGTLLVSARNTSTVYKIDRTTGAIVWRLGGKRSDFTMGAGATFSWQHDARRQPDGTLTIFDDSASPGHSRGIVLRLDEQAMTATLVRAFEHAAPLLARSQGNVQILPGGNVLVGWGDAGYVSEFSPNGKVVFDATYPAAVQSYRNYRLAWTGRPADPPAAAAVSGPGGSVTAFASWNGATEVATWDVLAGPSAGALKLAGSVPRSGFETSIPVKGPAQWVRVVARNAHGAVLGSSPIVNVSA